MLPHCTSASVLLGSAPRMPHLSSHDAATELIVFVGEAARGACGLARALERLGYATAEAPSLDAIGGARPPAAVWR